MKKFTVQWKLLIAITIINILVTAGFSIAGIVSPQTILRGTAIPNKASFIFALYSAARTIPFAIIAIYAIIARNKTSILILSTLAGFIQFFDGFIVMYMQGMMTSAGAFLLSIIQFTFVIWVWKTYKE